jgi:hypothetical protein
MHAVALRFRIHSDLVRLDRKWSSVSVQPDAPRAKRSPCRSREIHSSDRWRSPVRAPCATRALSVHPTGRCISSRTRRRRFRFPLSMSSWRRRWQFREGAVRPRVFPTMVSLSSVCGPHQPGPSTSSLCMCVSDTHRTTLSFAAMRAISVPPRPHIRFHATTGSTNPNLERPSAANAEQDNIQRSAPKNALSVA